MTYKRTCCQTDSRVGAACRLSSQNLNALFECMVCNNAVQEMTNVANTESDRQDSTALLKWLGHKQFHTVSGLSCTSKRQYLQRVHNVWTGLCPAEAHSFEHQC